MEIFLAQCVEVLEWKGGAEVRTDASFWSFRVVPVFGSKTPWNFLKLFHGSGPYAFYARSLQTWCRKNPDFLAGKSFYRKILNIGRFLDFSKMCSNNFVLFRPLLSLSSSVRIHKTFENQFSRCWDFVASRLRRPSVRCMLIWSFRSVVCASFTPNFRTTLGLPQRTVKFRPTCLLCRLNHLITPICGEVHV